MTTLSTSHAARLLIATVLALSGTSASADTLRDAVTKDMPSLISLYRDLHAAPELSMQEVKTSARLAAEMKTLGFQVTAGVGKTGLVAVLKNGPGPTLLIRTDMDALPVTEQTGLPFASKVKTTSTAGTESGVMHACGHDTHMTAWIGAARRLVADKTSWSGTLVMIGQPGEETGAGAKAMLDDGLFTRFPKPSHVIAFHDSASLPAGTIGYTPGPAFAAVDSVDVTVRGIGSHGAVPQNGRDPVVLAARMVGAFQTLVSRELDPQDAAVVTVGAFQAGTTHNIISDEARLLLTVRSYSEKTRRMLLDGIARIARGEAIAAGMPDDRMPVVTFRPNYTPATVNSDKITTGTVALFTERFGRDRVRQIPPPMVGEDFGRYVLAAPDAQSLIFWVGGVPQAAWDKAAGDTAELPSLHSPFWAPDAEKTIATATEAMVAAAQAVLKRP